MDEAERLVLTKPPSSQTGNTRDDPIVVARSIAVHLQKLTTSSSSGFRCSSSRKIGVMASLPWRPRNCPRRQRVINAVVIQNLKTLVWWVDDHMKGGITTVTFDFIIEAMRYAAMDKCLHKELTEQELSKTVASFIQTTLTSMKMYFR
jgi:hypothetical protein